jgi:hypothetical protein
MKSPIEGFFELGNKITKGDPIRKADWDYYLLWVMFLAFFAIFIDNLYIFFFKTQQLYNLGWAGVMVAMLWFQYHGLKAAYEMRKLIRFSLKNQQENIESTEDMLKGFKDEFSNTK